uniref:Spindle and centriole-associated protein 1 n=1 Tax=Xiphophorus couchianus TaxID=32473 RepID=A0A3B5LTD0_9TELE
AMLLRTGRPQQQQPKGKRLIRPKKAAAPKKDWVVSNLNQACTSRCDFSFSPLQCHRHEIHKSHNKAAAHWELREKALKLSNTAHWRNGDVLLQVFSEQPLLHDALAQSDRALAVVKDLFGDAPRRQTGHPSVTVAPNCDSDSELPVLQRPDPPTQLSLLSQSIMDQETRATQKQKGHRLRSHAGDKENIPVTPIRSGRAPDPTALNATAAVKRFLTKQRPSDQNEEEASVLVSQVLNPELPSRQSGNICNKIRKHTEKTRKGVCRTLELDGSSVASLSGDQSSLGLLQDMLGQVKANLDTMSSDIAPEPTGSPEPYERQGLTGFSVALVSTIGRLVQLIRKREAEAQEEAEERRRLQEDLKEQRGLMDALTAETMTLREEGAAMQVRQSVVSCLEAVMISVQAASSSTPSVEQRLLELNRQSAAARSRLLELIEQQKRSSSLRISPSVSPIPSSAVSPNAADELNLFLFSQQNEKRREREGWFSLVAHTR